MTDQSTQQIQRERDIREATEVYTKQGLSNDATRALVRGHFGPRMSHEDEKAITLMLACRV